MGIFSKITGGGGGGGGGFGVPSIFGSSGLGGALLGSASGLGLGGIGAGLGFYQDAQRKRNDELDRLYKELDPGAKPESVAWQSLLDQSTGRLASPYQLGAEGTAYGKVLEKYRQDAFRAPGEKSPEQEIMEQQLALQQQRQLGDVTTQAARQAAEGRAALASKRGLSGAAAERLAKSSGRDASRMMQQIRGQGAEQALGIQGQELANRRDIFNRLAGIEGDVETKNIQGALSEIGSGRQKKQSDYEEQMKAWAAGKQAQATIGAAKGGKK